MRALLIIAVMLSTTAAVANPFFLGRFSGLRSGPNDDGAFATYWNPSLLHQQGLSVQLNVLGVRRYASYDRDAELNDVPESLEGVNSGRNEVNGRGIVPSLAVRWGTTFSNWQMGFGGTAFIDRSGVGVWEKNLGANPAYPGALDGPQRFSTINTALYILNAGAGLGASYGPAKLSFGASVLGHYAQLSVARARNPDNTDRVVDDAARLAEGRILVDGAQDETMSIVVGAHWAPTRRFALGVTWHSSLTFQLVGPTRILFGLSEPTEVTSRVTLPIPSTLRVESRIGLTDAWTLRPMFGFSPWSVFQNQTAINVDNDEILLDQARNFDDLYFGRLAVDWAVLTNVLMLHAGITIENGVTPNQTFEPGLAESDNLEYAVGATIDVSKRWRLTWMGSWQEFADVTVERSVQTPTANGDYTDRRLYMTIDVEYHL